MNVANLTTARLGPILAVGLMTVSLIAGTAILSKLFQSQERLSDIVQILCSGFLGAEGSFVALWIGFGRRPLPLRLVFSIPCVAAIYIPYFTLPNGASAFALGMMLVCGLSIPSLVARAAGWSARLTAHSTTAQGGRAEKLRQFTLRQMFEWTLAFAMVAGLARLLLNGESLQPRIVVDLLVYTIVCFVCGAVALAIACATLGSPIRIWRLLAIVFLTGLLPYVGLSLFGMNQQATYMIAGFAAFDAVFVACGTLLFRTTGYRLFRQPT